MAESITAEALRQRMEKGERLTVLDIRRPSDFATWHIVGARPCDADVSVIELPRDRAVVVAGGPGDAASLRAAESLRERGFRAVALAGGVDAWSGAWNLAEVAMPRGHAHVLQVRRTGKGCLSYVVASRGEAIVIDPSVDPQVYLDLARARGWAIRAVLDTHVHEDHLSRARALAEAAGARLVLPRTARVRFPREEADEDARVRVGDAELRALRTPGHTREAVCYLLDGRALFSGDTLHLETVGRPEPLATRQETLARALAMHHALSRILALPPDTLLLPGHTSAPVAFDRRPLVATLHQVRERVPLLALPRDAFVDAVLERLPAAPASHRLVMRANEAGEPLPADATRLEAGPNACGLP